jgi:hypothetical protein
MFRSLDDHLQGAYLFFVSGVERYVLGHNSPHQTQGHAMLPHYHNITFEDSYFIK